MRLTFDSNILVYAADATAGDRHLGAVDLIARATGADCVQTLQSLSEFFSVATRKCGLPADQAMAFVDDWRTVFPVRAADESTLASAMEAVRDHKFSFWDAMILTVARQAGCRLLISEDLHDGQVLHGLKILNPFNRANSAILDAALPPIAAHT